MSKIYDNRNSALKNPYYNVMETYEEIAKEYKTDAGKNNNKRDYKTECYLLNNWRDLPGETWNDAVIENGLLLDACGYYLQDANESYLQEDE